MHTRSVLLRRDDASVTFWRLSVWQRMLVLDQLDSLAIIGENVYGITRMWVCREGRCSLRRPDGRLDADDGEARCCFADAGILLRPRLTRRMGSKRLCPVVTPRAEL